MPDNPYRYLCAQLSAALDDAPGGGKAWVPLRRSLAQACLEYLQLAAGSHDLLCELRPALDRILPAQPEQAQDAGANAKQPVAVWRYPPGERVSRLMLHSPKSIRQSPAGETNGSAPHVD